MSQTNINIALQRVYVKDVSFETPEGLTSLGKAWKPKLNLDLNTKVNRLEDRVFEVVLAVTATVTNEDISSYLCEVQQAGVFSIPDGDENQVKQVLGSECPKILFPYARECVSSLVAKGGFPQLVLAPVDFDGLYRQALAEQAQAADAPKH